MPGRDGASAAIGDHPPDRTDLSRPKPTTWRGAVDDDDGMSGTRDGHPSPAQCWAGRGRTPHPWRVIDAAATVASHLGPSGAHRFSDPSARRTRWSELDSRLSGSNRRPAAYKVHGPSSGTVRDGSPGVLAASASSHGR